jgi:hypothetical protein
MGLYTELYDFILSDVATGTHMKLPHHQLRHQLRYAIETQKNTIPNSKNSSAKPSGRYWMTNTPRSRAKKAIAIPIQIHDPRQLSRNMFVIVVE